MRERSPTFPPLLSGHRLEAGRKPDRWALKRAADGRIGAGEIVWSEDADTLRFALVLEPDVERPRCLEMLYVTMVAFGDAAGALCPPEVSVTYRWPSIILMNGAEVGRADLALPECEDTVIPDWMVVSLTVQIRPSPSRNEPGHDIDSTTMWDEGCGEISRTELLESTSRHIVNWIHTWSEDGFKPVHDQWSGRISDNMPLAVGAFPQHTGSGVDWQFVGLDESGNALVRHGDETVLVPTLEGLDHLRGGT